MLHRKSWEEFCKTGLLLFINNILHAFGWAIVVNVNEDGKVIDAYPARVKFRGFSELDTYESHKAIGNYLGDNAEALKAEVNE